MTRRGEGAPGHENRLAGAEARSLVEDLDLLVAKHQGSGPQSRGNSYGDISRIRADVGYEPEYQVDKAIPDYIAWLRAGNAE